jgi:hypothetical protein
MGSPRRPTVFGYKARIADSAEGFVIADVPQPGNPNDDRLLAGAIAKAKDAGMRVDCVLADRGFGTRGGDQALDEHEIKRAVIPRRGKAAPVEATRSWRRRYRFRNGLEGRISQLKRKGLSSRSKPRRLPSAETRSAVYPGEVGSSRAAHILR